MRFTCPRRREAFAFPPGPLREDEDEWRPAGGERGERCSYCGSIKPEEVFAAIDNGEELIPTDKDYKLYVEPGHRKFYFQHLSEEERKRFVDAMNEKRINYAYPGHFYRLPFFATRGRVSA
jgi:hypothetical protein